LLNNFGFKINEIEEIKLV